jgi:hypothetical protein
LVGFAPQQQITNGKSQTANLRFAICDLLFAIFLRFFVEYLFIRELAHSSPCGALLLTGCGGDVKLASKLPIVRAPC